MNNNKSFRVKYDNNASVDHLTIKLEQDFDFLEVLSLKIQQEDAYKLYSSEYGVVVGRVLANDGFGIPNAKISIFIKNNDTDQSKEKNIIYPYASVSNKNVDGVRYNLLSAKKVNKCHQNVGTFPSKRDLLDNNTQGEVFNEFYNFTTTTNEAGDYIIFGVPVGSQQIHVDIDLSDIGVLSQTPRDMTYKGFGLDQFESPNMFKKSTNLDSLSQIISENTSVYVYPFWGDPEHGEIAISKKNINVQYKFEPTCVFMGSIFSDSNKGGISKSCSPSKDSGVMSEMITSKGSIEMIRKTLDGKIENLVIKGNRLINSEGVWCYQIPMNLDYVITDEYGNIVPTDNPTIGIPTRTKSRFKVTIDNNGDSFVQSKTGSYLIPNNPKVEVDEDYSFGSECKDNSFVDLLWNKVYSVKNYIPRIQKGVNPSSRKFTGLKSINYHETNNPVPYNNVSVDINLRFSLICTLTHFLITMVGFINRFVIDPINKLTIKVAFVSINRSFFGSCGDLSSDIEYVVPIYTTQNSPYIYNKTKSVTRVAIYNIKHEMGYDANNNDHVSFDDSNARVLISTTKNGQNWVDITEDSNVVFEDGNRTLSATLKNCIETQLSSENQVVNFDFTNDWINGSLYAPKFLTKTKKNRRTGEMKTSFCGSHTINNYPNLHLVQSCAVAINKQGYFPTGTNKTCYEDKDCYKQSSNVQISNGNLLRGENNDVFYYRSVEFNKLSNKYFHPTNIILLGSLNDCDYDGIPQLHKLLPQTSFKLPPDSVEIDEDTKVKEMSGIDWGNDDSYLENGLFVSIGCLDSRTITKTCVNATRMCEVGVDFDETHDEPIGMLLLNKNLDGYISGDEISDGDVRSMFSTLNINSLKTKVDLQNQTKYDFVYNYPDFFDGRLRTTGATGGLVSDYTANQSGREDYYKFRFGLLDNSIGKDYSKNYSFPKYENSFYFYFGLKPGLTAIDVFNSQYFTPCSEVEQNAFDSSLTVINKESICQGNDGSINIKLTNLIFPYAIYKDNILYSSGNYTNTAIIAGLDSKYYSIKIVDGNGNSVSKTIFLPKVNDVTYNLFHTNKTSYIDNDGSITFSEIASESPNASGYIYSVKNASFPTTISGITLNQNVTVTGLANGNYTAKINVVGCEFDSLITQVEIGSPPYVSTMEFTVTGNTITAFGRIIDDGGSEILEKGVCFMLGTGQTPNIIDDLYINSLTLSLSKYSVIIPELLFGTTYNYRAYAENGIGVSYGAVMEFQTEGSASPTLTGNTVSNITSASASLSVNVLNIGNSSIIQRGVCWSTNAYPVITDQNVGKYIAPGTSLGIFSGAMSGLMEATTYHVRGYAYNTQGTGYTSDVIFETSPGNPSTTMQLAYRQYFNYATCKALLDSTGGGTIDGVGFCWTQASTPPTVADAHISGTLSGTNISATTPKLSGAIGSYIFRSYIIRGSGITYSTNTVTDTDVIELQ